jgi:hypothetical protein
MPGELTEVTELATAIGTLPGDLATHLAAASPPAGLLNVDAHTWDRLTDAWRAGRHLGAFLAAHDNGVALAVAADGLRGRPPQRVEWRGPQRTPGDDTVPADLRIDHVYLVSCKYLSRVLLNAGPPRLFDRLLVGDERSGGNWFTTTAPLEFESLYTAAVHELGLTNMPARVADLTRLQQGVLKQALPDRTLPAPLAGPWADLCRTVSHESAARWANALASPRDQLRMLWRLLRIASVTYFVLGTQPSRRLKPPSVLRLRVDAAWDWSQAFELRSLTVSPRHSGQPEVGWQAIVADRHHGTDHIVAGHVEVRWSHGRFVGSPEAKVYLDTPHTRVPGYHPLV